MRYNQRDIPDLSGRISSSVLPDAPIPDHQSAITLHDLLHETGLGIKLRFLLALTVIALVPALLLVLLLGDPSGREQQTILGQSMFFQAQAQAQALDSSITLRQSTVAAVATNPSLASVGTTGLSQAPVLKQEPQATSSSASLTTSVTEMLQTQQRADLASLAWILADRDGIILASGNAHDRVGIALAQTQFISNPSELVPFIGGAAKSRFALPPVLNFDTHTRSGWIAFAVPVEPTSAPHPVLLVVYSLPKLVAGLVATPQTISGSVAVLLDHDGRLVASAGMLSKNVVPFLAAPSIFQHMRLSTALPTVVEANPLTGRTDLAVGASVPTLEGRYVLIVPQDTSLVPSTRYLFAGRNTPLLLLFILVTVVFVATWIALPIVRPIRRATRGINATTQEVQLLSAQAQQIARNHRQGTMILSGTSKRLSTRRQSILRDSLLIQQACEALQPRIAFLFGIATPNSASRQVIEVLQTLQQGVVQIRGLANSIASGFEGDQSLSQLDSAMTSANEMSTQFEAAGQQLERGAQQLVLASRQLL